jgi:hypothetical protein
MRATGWNGSADAVAAIACESLLLPQCSRPSWAIIIVPLLSNSFHLHTPLSCLEFSASVLRKIMIFKVGIHCGAACIVVFLRLVSYFLLNFFLLDNYTRSILIQIINLASEIIFGVVMPASGKFCAGLASCNGM